MSIAPQLSTASQPRQVCTIPKCDSTWHLDDTCTTYLAELTFDAEASLPLELVQQGDEPAHVIAFGFDMTGTGVRRQMSTAESAREFAAQLRAAAAALDAAAGRLPASA